MDEGGGGMSANQKERMALITEELDHIATLMCRTSRIINETSIGEASFIVGTLYDLKTLLDGVATEISDKREIVKSLLK